MKLIALDAGHDLNTPGKRTPAIAELNNRVIKEYEFNSAVVKILDEELKRCGFNTLITAPDGNKVYSLKYRSLGTCLYSVFPSILRLR